MATSKKFNINIYSAFLFRLFRIEDELGINAHSDLPKLGAFFDAQGDYKAEAVKPFTDENVKAIIVRRQEVIGNALADKPEVLARVQAILANEA